MDPLDDAIDRIAADTGFSGVVRVDRGGGVAFARAYGLADRAPRDPQHDRHPVRDRQRHQGLDGADRDEPHRGRRARARHDRAFGARRRSAADRRRRDRRAPAGPSLGHRRLPRRGRGRRRQRLRDARARCTSSRRPRSTSRCSTATRTAFPPGERFAYNNGGYVVLALIAERASGEPFHELVRRRVCEPAGHGRHRVPALGRAPRARAALGYLHRRRSADERLPPARARQRRRRHLLDRRRLQRVLARALRRADRVAGLGGRDGAAAQRRCRRNRTRYGLGFWLHETRDVVWLEGYDAGVSFCRPTTRRSAVTHTVISNTSEGAWPITKRLDELLGT